LKLSEDEIYRKKPVEGLTSTGFFRLLMK